MKSKFLILFLFAVAQIFSQSNLKILSSNRSSITIQYSPVFNDTTKIIIDSKNYLKIDFGGGETPNQYDDGLPDVKARYLNIGVPSEFGNTIQVLSSSYRTIDGLICPIPYFYKDSGMVASGYKISNNYYNYKNPPNLVTFDEFGIARGLPVQTVRINPVKFDPSAGRITLYSQIVFKVIFSAKQTLSTKPADSFIRDAVINFNSAKYWVKVKSRRLNKVTTNSVLATGKWIRFEAPEEGIYKIDKATLSSFGIDPNSIDPRDIKIYNNGGFVLPENVTMPVPDSLIQNAIFVSGESDGKFDDGDYILFYGRGINFWNYDSTAHTIKRNSDPYSAQNYYWITADGAPGKRIQNEPSLQQNPGVVSSTTPAFKSWDEDKINILGSGRNFIGDLYNEEMPSHTYINKLDNLISGSEINYKFRFVNSDLNQVLLTIDENSSTLYSKYIYGLQRYGDTNEIEFSKGYPTIDYFAFNGNLPDDRSVLKFIFNATGSNSKGYIDYFEISYTAGLAPVDNKLIFYSPDTNAVVEYRLHNFPNSNIKVFDVSDFSNVKMITNPNLLSGGEFRFRKQETQGKVSKFIAVGSDNYLTPTNPEEIDNQNLHGINPGAEYVIITDKKWHSQAERLKNYRENEAKVKLSGVVVDIDKIFNEFSCGMTDVSGLRNFIKYAYDNWTIKPKYILLFGDGTYDYKNIEGANNNFIIPYESAESLNGITSLTTDDFFVRVDGNDFKPDLAIGRITVNSPTEADNIVDKIIRYETQSDFGNWRNLITLVADDGWAGTDYEGNIHTQPCEVLANNLIPKSYDINKIYSAGYPAILTGDGRRKPAVNQAILNQMNEGTLIVNFVGHGNPDVWTHEDIFDRNTSIPLLKNSRYFFLGTWTCDFGYFDETNVQSGAEELTMKPDGGSIAAFTSARVVYSNENAAIMDTVYHYLLDYKRDTLNLPITLGQMSFLTKVKRFGQNDQKYFLLGDPALRLLVPEYKAIIDSVDSFPVSSDSAIQVRALSDTKIKGHLINTDGTKWTDFSGEGELTVYDSDRNTLLKEINYTVTVSGGILFRGRVSINNGDFSVNFVVPKDISYENKNGKILLYFDGQSVDGVGFTRNIIVGGTDTTTTNDGNGPDIQIYFDNNSSKYTYLITPQSELTVKLSDATGLNTTGTGVGHLMEGILNDQESNPIDFTNYFTGDLDAGGKSGEINYKFNHLSDGHYKLQIKAWDVFNNYSTATTYFNLVTGDDLVLQDVYNYPNPFSSNTWFTFQQNLNKTLDVRIKIYTIAGRLIKEIDRYDLFDRFVKIAWDGTDEDGSRVANGTYLYKLIVRTSDGQFNKSVLGKLAIIR